MGGAGEQPRAVHVLALVAALGGCGRVGYGAARDAGPADAARDVAHLDAPGLDATPLDAGTLDGGTLDGGTLDGGALDGGAGPLPLPDACRRGPLPPDVTLPLAAPMPVARALRVVPAPDTDALTRALAAALPGDVIELEPGVSYRSAYTIATDELTLRTRGVEAAVPASRRVGPADAPALGRLVSGGALPTLTITGTNVHVVGLELATDALDAPPIVRSEPDSRELVLDRLYVHGAAGRSVRAGVELDGPAAFLLRSHVAEIHAMAGPRPAVLLFTCGGPIVIADNHLESAGEGVVLGTENALGVASSPHDVAICGNHITRSLAWYPPDPSYAGTEWPIGPLLGVYNGERVLLAGNVLERAWDSAGGSGARALALGPSDFAPAGSAHVSDVVFAWSHVRDVPEHLSFSAGEAGLSPLARVRVTQSLFEPIDPARFPSDTGRILQLLDGPAGRVRDVVIDHVTAPGAVQNGIVAESVAASGELRVEDAIVSLGEFGLVGGTREGLMGLPGLARLALIGTRLASYGPTSTLVPTVNDVGFVSADGADWALGPSSPFLAASGTGGPLGCDVARLRLVLAGVAP